MASVAHGLPEPVTAILLDAGGVLLELDYSYLQRLVEVRQPDVSIEALARAEALARRERNRAMADAAK